MDDVDVDAEAGAVVDGRGAVSVSAQALVMRGWAAARTVLSATVASRRARERAAMLTSRADSAAPMSSDRCPRRRPGINARSWSMRYPALRSWCTIRASRVWAGEYRRDSRGETRSGTASPSASQCRNVDGRTPSAAASSETLIESDGRTSSTSSAEIAAAASLASLRSVRSRSSWACAASRSASTSEVGHSCTARTIRLASTGPVPTARAR